MFLLVASPWDTVGLVGALVISLGISITLAIFTRLLAFRPSHKQRILSGQQRHRVIEAAIQGQPALTAEDKKDA